MNISNATANARPQTQARKSPANSSGAGDRHHSQKAPEDKFVTLHYLPQDAGMLDTETAEISAKGLGDGPSGPRFRVSEPDDFPTARADAAGNFLFRPDDPRFDAVNAYFIANRTLEMAQGYAGHTIPWAFAQNLGRNQMIIHPHSGEMENSFYSSDAGSLNFFHYTDADGVVARTAQEADVVAHETGHGILDALRPAYIRSLSVPAGGFHEGFGDMMAMLDDLHDPAVIAQLKSDTMGDLSKPNVVSRMAETLGRTAYGTPALRDLTNDLKYTDQHFIPFVDKQAPGDGLGTEPHAYANLFTGAFYDVFRNLYDVLAEDPDRSFSESVAGARDLAGSLLLRAVEFGPVGNPSYPNMAKAFLKADQVDNHGKLRPMLEGVFKNRRILSDDDIADFDAHQAALPRFRYNPSMRKAKGADEWLSRHRARLNIPKNVKLTFDRAYSNDRGEHFMVWGTHRDEALKGSDFGIQEGSKVRGEGGLVVAFNAAGKLIAANYDPVSDREMQNIKDNVRQAIAEKRMLVGDGPSNARDEQAFLHVNVVNDGNGAVLQKSGIVYS